MKKGEYRASLVRDKDQPTPEMRDLFRRRTLPFLDAFGLDRPISLVMEEVYLQGIRDAVEAMEGRFPVAVDRPDTPSFHF